MITVYAFCNVPTPVRALTRDLRALWALEEAGLPYRVHPIDFAKDDLRNPDYLRVNPFGRVPAIDDDGFKLFESAAIVFYVADKAGTLLPADARKRALAWQWAFAALNTVEPDFIQLAVIDLFHADKAWAKERRPACHESAQKRLAVLEQLLAGRLYVMGNEFTAPDILMSTVLRQVQHTELLYGAPNVLAYKERCEKRPAWKKVLVEHEKRLDDYMATA
ncbi:MAG: glutathione S-transferase family protein [Rhodospirillales bacterium]